VSSQWAADSLASGGVPAARLTCLQQPVDLNRYRCGPVIESSTGPLRVCCVGSLDLRKGFVYLLRAIRILGDHVPVSLRGTRSVLRDGSWWPHRHAVHVHVHVPLQARDTGWHEALRLRDAAREQIAATCGEPLLPA